VDVSLPIRAEATGGLHPITMATSELISIFGKMGFAVAEGPEIEDEFHNFDALNIPESHPARAMHDTFYIASERLREAQSETHKLLLRTHTSPVQIRAMKEKGAPIRIIAPGRTYRSDSDMTHTPMFHQIEGLCIEPNIHMGHLKHCLTEFVTKFFGIPDLRVRFRPSFFPFTEPSAEMDIGCERGKGSITLGKGQDWLEILGCGMVHPKVLTHVGIDATKYQGFAFGIGIERIAMLKYGIGDLRTFFESDVRFLSHYRFSSLDVANIGQMETK
jgi:phenylalanyl-tRNA synthetase alpha chain